MGQRHGEEKSPDRFGAGPEAREKCPAAADCDTDLTNKANSGSMTNWRAI
jgi:hypothetical protein